MDYQRLILLLIFSFSVLLLWDSWEKEQQPAPAPVAAVQEPNSRASAPLPSSAAVPAAPGTQSTSVPHAPVQEKGKAVIVRTDLFTADIDTLGATLDRLELLKYKATNDTKKQFVLFGHAHHYEAQSGLIGEGWPTHRTLWHLLPGPLELQPGADRLAVRFQAPGPKGVTVVKTFVFHRGRYIVDTQFDIQNAGSQPVTASVYYQLVRDDHPPAGQTRMMKAYYGPAVYTEAKKFEKVTFSDIAKGEANIPPKAQDGWVAMIEHYFVSALIAPRVGTHELYARKLGGDLYSVGMILSPATAAPGGHAEVNTELYAGPQERDRLKAAAPGLDLVVDYGWLTIIAWPLFAVLQFFHRWTGNWGFAIILLTVSIKLLFFPLSAASYKSMAKMKLVAPRMTRIREMYANDRQKMNQAMMELYRTEKINPLGGCFPIVVQIPVFIALYWVLLASIELRDAPFILWIHDLSALDPYYVLPVLMTITMFIQTRMNPTPPDPVQAKVMQFMPFVFSVFFFFFPAGLVLYWLVNNILSILQQWQIQRMFARDKPAHARKR